MDSSFFLKKEQTRQKPFADWWGDGKGIAFSVSV